MHCVILASGIGIINRGIGQYETYVLPPLLQKLEDANIRVSLILSRDGSIDYPTNNIRVHRLPVVQADSLKRFLSEQALVPFLTCGSDLFISLESVFPFTPILAKRRMAVIHDVHVVRNRLQPILYPEDYSRQYSLWASVATRRAARKSDSIVTVSEFTRDEVSEVFNIPLKRIIAIPNGVDLFRFSPSGNPIDSKRVRDGYRLPPRFYLFVGPYSRKKNLRLIVLAYAQLKRAERPTIPVVVVGDTRRNQLYQDTMALIRGAGLESCFYFLGSVPFCDLPVLYREAEAFLYPSLYEGFGLPVIESMASGTPVIASNQSSIPEVAGSAAILIDPLEPTSLIEALVSLDNPALRALLKEKGFAQSKKFSWEISAKSLAQTMIKEIYSADTSNLIRKKK